MKKVHLLLFAAILFFASCGNESENKVTHLPYQVEKDGRWGLIDIEGNPLIEEEFKKEPSVVVNGMFCVKNSDGLYEFYTAEKDFKQIGDEYLEVGYFSEGLAPVVKKDCRINYINMRGDVVFELTKYKDDPIESACSFENGIALVITASGKQGCINTKGDFIIPPTYSSIEYAGKDILRITDEKNKRGFIDYKGKVLVAPKYDYAHGFNENGYTLVELDGKEIIINDKGKEILKLKEDMKIRSWADENLMVYSVNNESYGYVNLKGEKVIKLPSNIKEPTSFFNGYAIFSNNDGEYGVINKKGEIVIRAKYDNLKLYDDFILYEDNDEWGFLDYSGEVIKRACYKKVAPFWEGYNSTFAEDDDEWILIDKRGEEIKKKDMPDIYNLYDFHGNGYSDWVKSDYLDIDTEVKNIMSVLKEGGNIDKMDFNMTPNTFENAYTNPLVDDNSMMHTLPSSKYMNRGYFMAYFDGTVKTPNYERQWIDSRWGGYWDNVITGYSYNDNLKVTMLGYSYELKGKLLEKKQNVYESMLLFLKNRGYKLYKEENGNGDAFYYYERDNYTLIMQIHNDFINIMTTRFKL